MDEDKGRRFIRWGEIDHRLASLKTSEIALEMWDITKKEKERIRFENLGNQNSLAVPSLFLQMHREQTDEWSRRICQAYREVCLAQGGRISAEAIRAVFQHAIVTLFAARINAVRADLTMEASRTGRNAAPVHAMLEAFAQEMERLKWRWSRKLEAEASECEHAEGATRRNHHQEQNQRENLRRAIIGRRVEIERINRDLDNLPPPGSSSRFGQPVRINQPAIDGLIRRRLEHEAALAELEREEVRLAALDGQASEEQKHVPEQSSEDASGSVPMQQTSPLKRGTYRTPYQGLKPEMKVVDFSDAMLLAKLTDKQSACYSLVREYQRPMNEVEQRMGITRKTIHEHITAAENALKKLSLKEYRAKAAAKHKHPE